MIRALALWAALGFSGAAAAGTTAVEGRDLTLLRFADPEPFRTVGLVRRRSSPDGGWFEILGEVAQQSGRAVLETVAGLVR